MSDKNLTNDELVKVLIAALDALREVEGDMYLTKAQALLHVYRSPGIAQSDLMSLTGISQPSTTRNVQDWTSLDRNRKPGRNFIAKSPDPQFRKRDLLEPTSQGLAFLEKMTKQVNKTLASTRS